MTTRIRLINQSSRSTRPRVVCPTGRNLCPARRQPGLSAPVKVRVRLLLFGPPGGCRRHFSSPSVANKSGPKRLHLDSPPGTSLSRRAVEKWAVSLEQGGYGVGRKARPTLRVTPWSGERPGLRKLSSHGRLAWRCSRGAGARLPVESPGDWLSTRTRKFSWSAVLHSSASFNPRNSC